MDEPNLQLLDANGALKSWGPAEYSVASRHLLVTRLIKLESWRNTPQAPEWLGYAINRMKNLLEGLPYHHGE